jgi:hypothetical protein
MLIALLLRPTLFPAGAKDANNNFKDVSTLYGSHRLSYEEALKLAMVGQVARSALSVLLSDTLLKAYAGKGLASADVSASSPFLTSCMLLTPPRHFLMSCLFTLPLAAMLGTLSLLTFETLGN